MLRRGFAPNPTRPLVGGHRPTPRPRGAQVRALVSGERMPYPETETHR